MKKNPTHHFLFSLLILFIPLASMAQFVCETVTSAKYASEEEEFNAWVLDFRDQGGHLDISIKYIPTVVHIIMKTTESELLWRPGCPACC
ncbi:MAG: hypothetical protein K0B37_05700 [Bacteroidales bacterium]|nr:hypothetical protein [Bacteroidales bacterium]